MSENNKPEQTIDAAKKEDKPAVGAKGAKKDPKAPKEEELVRLKMVMNVILNLVLVYRVKKTCN